jgi:hypothetical protein
VFEAVALVDHLDRRIAPLERESPSAAPPFRPLAAADGLADFGLSLLAGLGVGGSAEAGY